MYKKLIMFAGAACIAVAVFFSTSVNKSTTDMDLKNVVSVNNANAECIIKYGITDGRCNVTGQFCYGDPGGTWGTRCTFGY